ncbi:hypothetical protein D3C78_1202880 [compost metagenome]
MRNDNHGAVTLVKHLLQPANGIDVQVVRRFVEQQDFRIGEQGLRQQHTQLKARRDFAHRAIMLFDRDANTEQQLAGTRFGGVTVHFAVSHFQIGHFIAVFFAHFGHSVNTVTLFFHCPQFMVAHDNGVQHAVLLKSELILTQFTQALVRIEEHVAAARHQIAAQDFHKCRFAAAVGADQTIAVTAAKLNGDVFKQRLTAKLHSDVVSA